MRSGIAAFVALAAVVSGPAVAQILPPSITACAGQTDAQQRLACYDAAVSHITAPKVRADTAPSVAAKPASDGHIDAHIKSIESHPDALVVFLDNNQVWQQTQEATADPGLKAGDAVTIDKSFGSFWLSGRGGVAIKVRQKN